MAGFLDDYRAAVRRRPLADNAHPPTVGIGQEYRPGVAMPYVRWDAHGMSIVMPTSKVGAPPQERVLYHDETTDRWVIDPAQLSGTQSRVVNVGGVEYRIATDGRVYRQEYPAAAYGAETYTDPTTGQSLPANTMRPGEEPPPLEVEVTGDEVPVSIQQVIRGKAPKARAATPAEDAAGAATFGVTSPGGIAIKDTANPEDFYGSEYLADEEGLTAEQIATYRALPPNLQTAARQKLKTNPAAARYMYDMADREGIGRPQYAPESGGSVTAILNSMNPRLFAQAQFMMMRAGYLPSNYRPSPVASAALRESFAEVLTDANLNGTTWQSVLYQMSGGKKYGATGDGSGSSGGPTTTTSTQIALTSRTSAEQLIKQAWIEQYGQAPTEAQMADFVGALRGAERADPTTTTTTYDKSGNSTSVTEQSEVDPTAEALDFAEGADPKKRKEYMALQYFNLLGAATGDV